MNKTLPTQSYLLQVLKYDPTTGHLTWLHRPRSMFKEDGMFRSWNSRYAGRRAFTARTKKGYHTGAIDGLLWRANRVIFKMMTGRDPNQVDHIDGDNQNDTWHNLREVTHEGNQRNMKRSSLNTSGTTGVYWNTQKQRWQASIGVGGKTVLIGRFVNKSDAINARKQAEAAEGYHPNHGRH